MKRMKKISLNLLNSDEFKKILSRDERKRIIGGYTDCASNVITEQATTAHECDPCGIDKDHSPSGVCCLSC